MSVAFDGTSIALAGDCGVEEAESLMTLVQANPDAPVDVSGAGSVHTALWQVMIDKVRGGLAWNWRAPRSLPVNRPK